MSVFRSERIAALLLLAAALLGLIVANSPVGAAALDLQGTHLAIPALGIDLSIGHWISDGLLAVFFLLAAIELRHELTTGELNSPARALRPAVAALGGVLVPIAIFLSVVALGGGGSDLMRGWPVPTATDIAFALGVLAVFGRGMPARVRSFLLALAILDDIIAIVIIAVVFAHSPDVLMLGLAVLAVIAFGLLSRVLGRGRFPSTAVRVVVTILLVVLGLVAWMLVLKSGIHATIAGVALGLAMSPQPAGRLRHRLEPISNATVLPLFAFSAALVVIPAVSIGELSPVFWAIALALPLGKIIGISIGAMASARFVPRAQRTRPDVGDALAVGALGGIGFTVSLLMNGLAFADHRVADEGTLAVLLGSGVSIVLAAVLLRWRLRVRRRRDALAEAR
ncbi:Na+/H+ antiporter NhaA [Schumannella sp. 10F1B-5-1]|uniref:Na+/H+ antiporter NhaA n=1 Tax=Schumannella sp. 10F1B-5-1 TaxID=2590780 RepID=UPI001131F7BC|nr:Na+/H+ antiporter NhaA [Schumannella sp. 10F1B-5-1]TPW73204.1 Na+/H+ antiporter NhaA [Schumannella sp. 10F1B-5-1]